MPLKASSPPPHPPARKPERIRARQAKKLMIELLSKYPIVEAACSKVDISRSTHYEWMNKDAVYREKVERAIAVSIDTVSDLAENNIVSSIKRGEYKATTFWLNHRHPAYKTKPPSKSEIEGLEMSALEKAHKLMKRYISPEEYIKVERQISLLKFSKKSLRLLKKYVGDE